MRAAAKQWALRVAAAILIVFSSAIALVLLALISVHSPWAHDYLRELVQDQLQERLSEPVKIDSVRAFFDGRVVIETLVVGEHGEVASVPSLTAKIDLAEAITGRIRIAHVDIDSPTIDVLALADALVIPEPEPGGEPPDVWISDISVTNGTVGIGDVDVTDASLSASLRLREVLSIPEARISGTVTYRGLTGDVDTTARLIGDQLIVDSTRITSAGASVQIHAGTLDIAALQAFAVASAVAPAHEVRRIAGEFGASAPLSPLTADANLPVVAGVLRSVDPLRLWSVVAGTAGGATLSASAKYEADEIRGAVAARNVVPSQIWKGAPDASLSLELSGGASLASFEPGRIKADIAGRVGGAFSGESVEIEDIELFAGAGRYKGELRASTENGSGTASATVAFADGTWRVETSKATVENLGLDRFGVPGLAGTVTKLTVDARGPAKNLKVTATGRARSVRYDQASAKTVVGSMSVSANLFDLPDSYPTSGGLAVTARGASYGGETLTSVTAKGTFAQLGDRLDLTVSAEGNKYARRARAGLSIRRSPARTRVELGEVSVTTTDVTWSGSGGAVTLPSRGSIELSAIALSSPAGRLSADGEVDGDLVVEAQDADLRRIGRIAEAIFGAEIPVTGHTSIKAVIADRGRKVTVEGSFSDLAYKDLDNRLDGELSLSLADGELSAVVEAAETSSGVSISVDGAVAAPRSVFDAPAWARLHLGSIRRGVVDLERITPELISGLIGRPVDASGTAGVHVRIDPGATRLAIDVEARNVAVAGMTRLEADVGIVWDETGAAVDITTRRRKRPLATISGRVEAPLSVAATRTPAAWKRTAASATVTLDRLNLNRLNRLNLISEPLLGTVNATVELSGTFERPVGEIVRGQVDNLRVAGALVPVVKFGGRADLDGANGWVRAEQANKGSLDGSITTVWSAPEKTVVDITGKKVDLRVLRALATEPTHILALAAGTLDAGVHLEGDPRSPVGRGSVRLRDGQLLLEGGARRLTDIELSAKFDGDEIDVQRLSARSGEGKITARGKAKLSDYVPKSFSLDAKTVRFPYAVGGFAISADAEARIDGVVEDGWIRARANVTKGLVRLERSGRELHDTGALEDVVFIDEILKPGEKTKTGGIPPIELVIDTRRPIRVRGKELDVRVRSKLTAIFLDGSLNSLDGSAWVTRGWVALFDRRYNVIVGRADFEGRVNNPEIDVQLSRQFPIADVRVHVYNDVDDPKIALMSDAGHAPVEVVTIMLGGDPDADDRTLSQNAVGAGIGAGSFLAKNVAKHLPVRFDVVRIHDDGFEVGRWFFGKVLTGYRFRVPDTTQTTKANQHEGTLEWSILRRLVLEAKYGDQAVGNADLLYIIRF